MTARLELDLFDEAVLRDPYPTYSRLRQIGEIVPLVRPEVWAVPGYGAVTEVLRRSDAFISGQGVGFSDAFNAAKGRNVLQSDGDLHQRMRNAVAGPLAAPRVKLLRPHLRTLMDAHVGRLLGGKPFDAMRELAPFLPLQAISQFVGLPEKGRQRMLEWAAAAFNIIGLAQPTEDLERLAEYRQFMAGLTRADLQPESWAERLFAAAEDGRLSAEEAHAALSAYVIPSLDTTILAKGNLLANLARNPDQWRRLRNEPGLIPSAVLEGVRHHAVIRWFSRVAVADTDLAGVAIPQGTRLMLIYGSANRDGRRFERPDAFDVGRDARGHLTWGTGPHICAGMHLARVEMEVMLEALVAQVTSLELAGEVQMSTNRGLFGPQHLPLVLK